MILDRESMQNHKHVEKQRVLVVLQLTSGECLFGFFHAGHSERISDVLNDQRTFLPFEVVDGERMIHAKTSIMRVYEICNVTRHFHHPDPYVVLNVSRADSWETIQRAYRQQMVLCHPDRYAHRNPPEAALELLDRIASRLNEVMDQIKPNHISSVA
ncbi:J domain-containing protein [Emcibacter sp. SYSU 3D8]|uniref:J domain-containing protein n=1 Tax=Emcibacter sp. SYSU 3D8 TaxID=3133969 RepID=UPI0031FF1EFE